MGAAKSGKKSPLLMLVVCVFGFVIPNARCQSWSLSNDQRRQFLRYYAPLLFKRAEEKTSRPGYDWLTNFDFDSDQTFSNNKDNWEKMDEFVSGDAFSDWQIRPTMYTGMLEYMSPNGSRKDATLLYHVYHAKQRFSIHDWERIEVRLFGITGDPGSGEDISYVVVTEHGKHNFRREPDGDLNFFTTAFGRHPMIWQAQQHIRRSRVAIDFFNSNFLSIGAEQFYGGELHFVEDSMSKILDVVEEDDKAEVDVNGGDEKNFHYLFVPEDDLEAVSFWKAETLTQSNSDELSHKKDYDGIPVSQVMRIKYELQDLADIFPTHWSEGLWERHWSTDKRQKVLLESELAGGIDGGPDVEAGLQLFYARSKDVEDKDEDRNGYPVKSWFWGAYKLGSESIVSEARKDPDRAVANGDAESIERLYWHQHDFFVHDGPTGRGRWLSKGWNEEENGGFDGRWVQLFN